MSRTRYLGDDGLDWMDESVPARGPYVYGDESDCGDVELKPIGPMFQNSLERANLVLKFRQVTDSPIEDLLGAAILMQAERADLDLKMRLDGDNSKSEFTLVPQFRWEIYRSDLAIIGRRRVQLLIECDGKEFHSSPEQKAHDGKKDAAAAARGWRTVRFTGSEIHRDFDGCAAKILRLIRK